MTSLVQGPKVVILLPSFWSVRNIVYSDVLTHLKQEGVRVCLLTYDSAGATRVEAIPQAEGADWGLLLERSGKDHKGKAFLNSVIRSAFSRRNHTRSYAIYRRWEERSYRFLARFRSLAIWIAGALAQSPMVLDGLGRYNEHLFRRSYDLTSVQDHLRTLGPDLVWSTMCTSSLEYPYLLAARDLNIPVAASILSFDNLTSRSALPLFDHYTVWSERMKAQLLRLYTRVSSDQVAVTGTPQFDFHRDSSLMWSRTETLERLGLDLDARYFLYATSHRWLAPAEPELVGRLARRMRADDGLRNCWLVIRPHPLDQASRWDTLRDASSNVTISSYGKGGASRGMTGVSSLSEQSGLISSLAHSVACINIASTITLDAAVLDRPVIGIDFRSEASGPKGILYEEYDTDHYAPLAESGGVSVARKWSDLLELMRQALTTPERDRDKRELMVRSELGNVDGYAARRVAHDIARQAAALRPVGL